MHPPSENSDEGRMTLDDYRAEVQQMGRTEFLEKMKQGISLWLTQTFESVRKFKAP